MANVEQEMEPLRREHARLSRRITRFRLLRLLVLTLLVAGVYAGYWLALKRVDAGALRQKRQELALLDAQLGKHASTVNLEEDPIGFRDGEYNSGVPRLSTAPAPAAPAAAAPPAAERDQLERQFRDAKNQLTSVYDDAFERDIYLGAFWVTVDVRKWPGAIPLLFFLFVASSVYVHILRKKRELVECVAAQRLEGGPAQTADLGRLLFAHISGSGSPLSHATFQWGEWSQRLYILALLAALLPLVSSAKSADDLLALSGVMGCAAAYLGVYGRYVSTKLEWQAAGVTGEDVPPTWVARWWQKLRRWSRPKILRENPKWSLLSGSLLVLMTLYLGTSVGGCGDAMPGYHIVKGRYKWPSADLTEDSWLHALLPPLTRSLYTLSLALAALALVLFLWPRLRSALSRERRWTTLLLAVSGGLSLFVLGDFTFFPLLLLAPSALPWILFWLAPLGLWLWFGLSPRKERRARWERIRAVLEGLYFPVILCDLSLLVTAAAFGYFGLITFFFGIHLLTFGFEGLTFSDSAAVTTRLRQLGAS